MASTNEDELLSTLESLYTRHNQSHVFKHIKTLTPTQRTSFLHQLSTIDVATLSSKFTSANATLSSSSSPKSSTVVPYSGEVGLTSDPTLVSTCREIGLSALSNGETAALLLAGGQGTRLGFDGPKGMYDIDLPSHKPLFQLIAERLRSIIRLSSSHSGSGTPVTVPLYIMTSPLNDDVTRRYFETNDYFGLPPSSLFFFSQGVLPCLSPTGKILLERPDRVAVAPDGNGGVYPALRASGALADMTRRGVKYVHAFAIDNALVRPVDPVFLGYCVSRGADCGNKVVWKVRSEEKVGVLAQDEDTGACRVVEYSDLDVGAMRERDERTGRLRFGAGNICNHFYTVAFLEDVVLKNMDDMYHVARKKIPVFDEVSGRNAVTPEENNGIKLETFIFDVFPLAKAMAVLDVRREEEFAPVKNAPGAGVDSPEVARRMISNLSKKWVVEKGGKLIGDEGEDVICEVSPLTSYAGEGLYDIVVGKEITCPFIL